MIEYVTIDFKNIDVVEYTAPSNPEIKHNINKYLLKKQHFVEHLLNEVSIFS